jgi:hypothetical protein
LRSEVEVTPMTNLEIALKYMDIFYSGKEFDELAEIFFDNLVFEGPLFRFDSASDYIESLKSDPPVSCEYRLIRVFESTGSVNLIYEFIKGEIRTPMSQLFEFENGRISRILLVFDTARFKAIS